MNNISKEYTRLRWRIYLGPRHHLTDRLWEENRGQETHWLTRETDQALVLSRLLDWLLALSFGSIGRFRNCLLLSLLTLMIASQSAWAWRRERQQRIGRERTTATWRPRECCCLWFSLARSLSEKGPPISQPKPTTLCVCVSVCVDRVRRERYMDWTHLGISLARTHPHRRQTPDGRTDGPEPDGRTTYRTDGWVEWVVVVVVVGPTNQCLSCPLEPWGET